MTDKSSIAASVKVNGTVVEDDPVRVNLNDEVIVELVTGNTQTAPKGRWSRGGEPIGGASDAQLEVKVHDDDSFGEYRFVDETNSQLAVVTLKAPDPDHVDRDEPEPEPEPEPAPGDIQLEATVDGVRRDSPVRLEFGDLVTMSARTAGGAALEGSWLKNGEPVEGGDQAQIDVPLLRTGAAVGSYRFTTDGGVSSQAEVKVEHAGPRWLKALKGGGIVLLLFAIYLALSLMLLLRGDPLAAPEEGGVSATAVTRAYLFAALTVVAFLSFVEIAGRSSVGKSGVVSLISGSDMRASTSKVQYLLWTFLLGAILAFIAGYAAMVTGSPFQCTDVVTKMCVPSKTDEWGPYLILLGVPASAAVVAKGLVAYKVANGTLQKTEADSPATADLATNDRGSADLVDIQYLMFNLIALAYVAAAFISSYKLPIVPELLLALTSAAGATYVLNKALVNNKPRITSVTPSLIAPGDLVTVKGENLLVTGGDGEVPSSVDVKIAGARVVASRVGTSKDTLQLTAPEGMTGDSAPTLAVITAANIESEGFPISIATLTVVGWDLPTLPSRMATGQAKLRVTGLPATAHLVGQSAVVAIAGRTVKGTFESNEVISLGTPANLDADEVEVTVTFQGRVSASVKLPLAP